MPPLSSFQIAGTVVDVGHKKRIVFDDEAVYMANVNRMAVGSCVLISVEEDKPHRAKTWDQIKYWKGCAVPLVADHCGMSEKQAELAMLGEKYGYVDATFGGHSIPQVTSVKDLSVEEMTELISWALDWCPATLEIILPKPDKDWRKHEDAIRRQLRRPA